MGGDNRLQFVPEAQNGLENIAMLDGPDTGVTQRFIASNLGMGAIGTSKNQENRDLRASWIPLSEPGAIMGELIDLLKQNHKSQNTLPPLVANLTSLMEGLQAAVTSSPL